MLAESAGIDTVEFAGAITDAAFAAKVSVPDGLRCRPVAAFGAIASIAD